jgi:MYXO-CTERM domain-containing protein
LNQSPPNALPEHPDPNDPTRTVRGVDLTSIYGPLTMAPRPDTMLPLFSQPSLGDMDQDGVPDVLATGGSLTLAQSLQANTSSTGANLLSMWSGKTGAMLPASPMVLEDFTFLNSSAVADINGDGYPEALVGSGGYYLHAYDACGREPTGWPKFTGQWIIPTPAVGDLDGDGKLDVAVGTRDGWLYAWKTEGSTDDIIEWESYHHDNRNTGNYDVKLDQGGSNHPTPLTVEMCQAPTNPGTGTKYEIAGGCNCDASGASEPPPWLGIGVVAGALAAFGRRRKRAA